MKAILTHFEDRNRFLLKDIVRKLSFGITAFLLLFLPFQMQLVDRLNLPHPLLWMDEFFVILIFILFVFIFLYRGKIHRGSLEILFCLIYLGMVGIISGLLNDNLPVVTANGIFDYIKNFLIIPAACFFPLSGKRANRIYKILHRLALFFCIVAILQETAFFFKLPVQKMGVSFFDVRFGLMRAPSLMGHPNVFGLYSLLFFILDFSLHQKIRWQNLLLISGIFLSVSRMVWVAFFVSFLYLLIQGRSRKKVLLFMLATILIAFAIPSFYLFTIREIGPANYFRGYALYKSLEIFKDHPIWGAGPGTYGGVISFIFDSPIYGKYNFNEYWLNYMRYTRSLDQFWPQIMVEMGLLGALSFGLLLFKLWQVARKVSLVTENPFRKKILLGFSDVPIVLVVYLFGSGLNLTPFLLTYGLLFGIILGMKDESPFNK